MYKIKKEQQEEEEEQKDKIFLDIKPNKSNKNLFDIFISHSLVRKKLESILKEADLLMMEERLYDKKFWTECSKEYPEINDKNVYFTSKECLAEKIILREHETKCSDNSDDKRKFFQLLKDLF